MTEEGLEMWRRHEGLRLKAYLCPSGKLTIGYGHTGGVKQEDVITTERAEEMLAEDMAIAEKDARALVRQFDQLSPRRQDALINLAGNMGRTVLGTFHNFLNDVRTGNFTSAATSLACSKWAKQVGPTRSGDIIGAIRRG
jgi:lysozyme